MPKPKTTTVSSNLLVRQFREAEAAADAERKRWNALTGEQRQAENASRAESGDPIVSLWDNEERTAKALLAAAARRHHIEQRAVVYLVLGPDGTWQIDYPTDDGYPLEGYDNGAINEQCPNDEDEDGDHDTVECEAVRDAANHVHLPDAKQLRDLLVKRLA